MDSSDFFNKYMIYEGYSEKELRNIIINGGGRNNFIPATGIRNVYLGNSQKEVDCLTFVTRSEGNSVAICAVFRMDDIQDLFLKNAFLWIISENGTILAGEPLSDEEDYLIITDNLPAFGLKIGLGVPKTQFLEQVKPLQTIIKLIFCIIIITGFVFAFLLSIYAYMPLYKFVKDSFGKYSIRDTGDEFSLLRKLWQQANASINNLQNMLQTTESHLKESVLINSLLAGESIETDDVKFKVLEEFNTPCRLALFNINSKMSEQSISKFIYERLDTIGLSAIRLMPTRIAVIFRDSERSLFEDVAQSIINNKQYDWSSCLSIVVSGVFDGLRNACHAYQCVLAAVASRNEILYYIDDNDDSYKQKKERFSIYFQDVSALNNAMRAGNISNIERVFETVIARLETEITNLMEVREYYYNLRSVPAMFICEFQLGNDIVLPLYDERGSPARQFSILGSVCIDIISDVCGESKSYKDKLMQYINENFCNPELYAGHLADMFMISTKQVSRIVREYTGMCFSDYLQYLRLKKAVELLTETDKPVAEIANECGYNAINTFYRAFKKEYGIAPVEFRRNLVMFVSENRLT